MYNLIWIIWFSTKTKDFLLKDDPLRFRENHHFVWSLTLYLRFAEAGYLANTSPLFCQLRPLDVFTILIVIYFNILIILFPSPFSCIRVTTIFASYVSMFFHDRWTIPSKQYSKLPFNIDHIFVELILKKFNILYQGPKVWIFNYLSLYICFKKSLKNSHWKIISSLSFRKHNAWSPCSYNHALRY